MHLHIVKHQLWTWSVCGHTQTNDRITGIKESEPNHNTKYSRTVCKQAHANRVNYNKYKILQMVCNSKCDALREVLLTSGKEERDEEI